MKKCVIIMNPNSGKKKRSSHMKSSMIYLENMDMI